MIAASIIRHLIWECLEVTVISRPCKLL